MDPYDHRFKKRKSKHLTDSRQTGFYLIEGEADAQKGEETEGKSSLPGSFMEYENEAAETDNALENEEEITQLLAALRRKPRPRSHSEKQERLFAKWCDIHEELAWELLCFQSVDSTGSLPGCDCPMRRSRVMECICVEGTKLIEIFYCENHPIHSALVRQGYFPASPDSPKKAFQINVFELYRHLLAFGVSHQAWCTALWNLHNKIEGLDEVPYRKSFLEAFNMYERAKLWGSSIIEERLEQYQNSHINKGCIACPPPKALRDPEDESKTGIGWQMLASFDGNYGLKHMSSVRDVESLPKSVKTFFDLDEDFDAFNEAHGHAGREVKSLHGECGDQFKAAQDNMKAKEKVDITGVFAMTCARHGWAYRGLNFRGTGERMVYGLRILDWLADEWPAGDIKILYDINCVFKKFVEKSVLAEKARGISYAVPIFHAYAHNARCQFQFHPRYIEGYGLTDGEWVERLWSYLVHFVPITKWMRPEHRGQILEFAILEWNNRIKRGIGQALAGRIRRSTDIIQESNDGLAQYRDTAGGLAQTNEELLAIWEEHKAYILQQRDEPELSEEDIYFVALYQYDQAVVEAQRNGNHHASVARAERLGIELQKVKIDNIEGLEGGRWPIESHQYQNALVRYFSRKMLVVVKELHRLVIGKSFEILRLHHGRHIGTKLTQKIMEGIRRTNANIKKRIEKINEMASTRPELARFSNTSWDSAASPNGSFWTGYGEWLITQGQQLLHPRELIAVRYALYLKRAEEEFQIIEAEIYRATKWARHRVEKLGALINLAKEAVAVKINSLENLGPMEATNAARDIEMIKGQLAVYYRMLSDGKAQLHDLESRFPQGRAFPMLSSETPDVSDQTELTFQEEGDEEEGEEADILDDNEFFEIVLGEMDDGEE